jgi:hypothetical protein
MADEMAAPSGDGGNAEAAPQTNTPKLPANDNLPDRDAEEHELLVNGEKRKVTLAEMKKQLAKEWAGDKKLQEATLIKKNVEGWLEDLKRDGPAALKRAGLNPKEFFKQVMEEEARRGLMSPEEIEREEIKAENARLKEEMELTKKEKQELWQKQQDELIAPEVEQKIVAAAQKVGLPGDPWTLEKLIAEIEDAEKHGMDISFEQAAILANHKLKIQGHKDRQAYQANLSGADLAADLGPENVMKLFKWSKEQAMANGAAPKPVAAPKPNGVKPRGYISEIDLAKKWR